LDGAQLIESRSTVQLSLYAYSRCVAKKFAVRKIAHPLCDFRVCSSSEVSRIRVGVYANARRAKKSQATTDYEPLQYTRIYPRKTSFSIEIAA
jgi:hypothetical protein